MYLNYYVIIYIYITQSFAQNHFIEKDNLSLL